MAWSDLVSERDEQGRESAAASADAESAESSMPRSAPRPLSLRRRLGLIAALGVVLFAGSTAAFAGMRREFRERLVERAQFEAERALDRISDADGGGRALVEECSVGMTRGGRLPGGALTGSAIGVDEPTAARLRSWLPAPGGRPHVELVLGATPGVVVARRALGGDVDWAMVEIAQPRVVAFWKGVAAALSLVLLALVAAAVDAVRVVRRAASSLEDSARTLASDLAAPVARPDVRELAGVADGLRSMAGALLVAQHERERLQSALAREHRHAALGRMAGSIAHEIRNPLAAIKLRVDLLREEESEQTERSSDLSVCGDEIDRLERLVIDLLVHLRTAPPAASECDVGALANERVRLLAPWAASREVSVRATGAELALIDRDGLARALDNLLRNAVEAAPSASRVDVVVGRVAGALTVDVFDDGPGVRASDTAQLFEPFFTTKATGTGLGLSLTKAVARAHGGDVEYARDHARTRFTLTIPDAASR